MYFLYVNIFSILISSFFQNCHENSCKTAKFEDLEQIKIYVHTDKNTYYPADFLYFKTYTIFTSGNKDTVKFRNLYIELYNPNKQLVYQRLLKSEKGFAHGYFFLSDTISTGDYWLVAHTCNLNISGENKIFHKKIRIENSSKTFYSFSILKKSRTAKNRKNEIELSLYPEGQKIICGFENTIAISATDKTGNNIKTEGKIFDQNDKICAEFSKERNKYGIFKFKPEKPGRYKVEYKINSKKKNFFIEVFQITGSKIETEEQGNKIQLLIKRNPIDSNKNYSILVKTTNNKIIFPEISLKSGQDTILFEKDILPEGIIEFFLLDSNKNLLSTSYYYKTVKNTGDKITLQEISKNKFKIFTSDTNISKGNFSISVNANTPKTSSINITEYFSYYSNLKNATYKENIIGSKQSLIIQMPLLQENTNNKINKNFCKISGITISGKILTERLNLPANNIEVELTILNKYNEIFTKRTDSLGRYEFSDLNYNDTIEYLLKVFPKNTGRNYIFYPDSISNTITVSDIILDPDSVIEAQRQARALIYQNNANGGYSELSASENRLHRYADRVIYFDDNTEDNSSALQAVANRVTGVNQYRESMLRGSGSFITDSEPMYLVDGIISDKNALRMISAADVERVEILTNPINTSIYGHNGANGIVAVYTKRGYHVLKNMNQGKIPAYHVPKKFEQESELINKVNSKLKEITIFWEPNFNFSSDNFVIDLNEFSSGVPITVTLEGLGSDSKPIYFSKKIIID